jgi:hypothetical protein
VVTVCSAYVALLPAGRSRKQSSLSLCWMWVGDVVVAETVVLVQTDQVLLK